MSNGKIRDCNHIIDEQALRFIRNQFPPEWVQREFTPDYGLDIDLELFDYENEKCTTLGEHLFLQIKGTEHPNYDTIKLFGEEHNQNKIKVIKFSLEVAELNLVERMGSALPVLLLVFDLTRKCAYHICLNDYIKKVLPLQQPQYKQQDTVTVYIPVKNKIISEDLRPIRWYGKRAKIYALFQEMIADIGGLPYLQNEQIVDRARRLVDQYLSNDAWKARSFWPAFNDLYGLMQELHDNDMIHNEDELFVQRASGIEDGWEMKPVYLGSDLSIPAHLAVQKKASVLWQI